MNGRISDGGVWQQSPFQKKFNSAENVLKVPEHHVLIGDDAFPLATTFMKPFRGSLTRAKEVFNYRLSRARRCVENAFGILVARFSVLSNRLSLCTKNAKLVVLSCCILHNFLLIHQSDSYIPTDSVDVTHADLTSETIHLSGLNLTARFNRATDRAKAVRDWFVSFFTNQGSLPFQDNYISYGFLNRSNARQNNRN